MKLQAEVDNDNHEIEIIRDGRRVVANVNGRKYDLDVSEPEADGFLIKNGGRVYEAMVSGSNEEAGSLAVSVLNHQFNVRLWDPKRLRGSSADGAAMEGIADIRSAMPGKIVRILTQVGSQVEKGEGIIVVEAMKMQNELKAPKAGQVKEIRVALDATVSSGDVLVVIE